MARFESDIPLSEIPHVGERITIAKVAEIRGEAVAIFGSERGAFVVEPEDTPFTLEQLGNVGDVAVAAVGDKSSCRIVKLLHAQRIVGIMSLLPEGLHGRIIHAETRAILWPRANFSEDEN